MGKRETKKRQTPVRLPTRLLVHIRRWKGLGLSRNFVVEHNGQPVGEVNKGFASSVAAAGFGPDGTPHVLRHTCATWLMQRGADIWESAGFLGMTYAMLESTYGHPLAVVPTPCDAGVGWQEVGTGRAAVRERCAVGCEPKKAA